MTKRIFSLGLGSALMTLMLSVSQTTGAIFDLDFNSDPEALGVSFHGSSLWESSEGVDDSGYLAVTFAEGSQRGSILFPDLENGAPLLAFDITADLRVGGGTALPADGFSFNFARPEDPSVEDILVNGGNGIYASSPTGEADLPEEGTQTGLAIGFDEWFSGGDDVIGMSIRIDNELVEQIGFPTANGDVDDQTSLQTGGQAADIDDYNDLGWARLELSLATDDTLRIAYKGLEVYNDKIDYERGPGLFIFAGRTGGSNANHHIDNISLRTNSDASGWDPGGGGMRGDFNNDGVLDALDIDALTAQSASGANNADYDLNGDAVVDAADVDLWISADDIYKSWSGDANLDREFSSSDLVTVLSAGKYEAADAAVWTEGDFNGDGKFDSSDLVTALSGGGYELGPKAATAAMVPEPASCTLLILGALMLVRRRQT